MMGTNTNTRLNPVPPKTFTLTQASSESVIAKYWFNAASKRKKAPQEYDSFRHTSAGKSISLPSIDFNGFLPSAAAPMMSEPINP